MNCILSVFSYCSCIYFIHRIACIYFHVSGNNNSCSGSSTTTTTTNSSLVIQITKILCCVVLYLSLQPNHSHSHGFFLFFFVVFFVSFRYCFGRFSLLSTGFSFSIPSSLTSTIFLTISFYFLFTYAMNGNFAHHKILPIVTICVIITKQQQQRQEKCHQRFINVLERI